MRRMILACADGLRRSFDGWLKRWSASTIPRAPSRDASGSPPGSRWFSFSIIRTGSSIRWSCAWRLGSPRASSRRARSFGIRSAGWSWKRSAVSRSTGRTNPAPAAATRPATTQASRAAGRSWRRGRHGALSRRGLALRPPAPAAEDGRRAHRAVHRGRARRQARRHAGPRRAVLRTQVAVPIVGAAGRGRADRRHAAARRLPPRRATDGGGADRDHRCAARRGRVAGGVARSARRDRAGGALDERRRFTRSGGTTSARARARRRLCAAARARSRTRREHRRGGPRLRARAAADGRPRSVGARARAAAAGRAGGGVREVDRRRAAGRDRRGDGLGSVPAGGRGRQARDARRGRARHREVVRGRGLPGRRLGPGSDRRRLRVGRGLGRADVPHRRRERIRRASLPGAAARSGRSGRLVVLRAFHHQTTQRLAERRRALADAVAERPARRRRGADGETHVVTRRTDRR